MVALLPPPSADPCCLDIKPSLDSSPDCGVQKDTCVCLPWYILSAEKRGPVCRGVQNVLHVQERSVDSFHNVRLQRRWSFKPTRRRENGTRSRTTKSVGRNAALFQNTKLLYITGGIRNCEKTALFRDSKLFPTRGEKRRSQNLSPKRW
jgi:hypothetical protein